MGPAFGVSMLSGGVTDALYNPRVGEFYTAGAAKKPSDLFSWLRSASRP